MMRNKLYVRVTCDCIIVININRQSTELASIVIIVWLPLCTVVGRRPQHATSKLACLVLSFAISCPSTICTVRYCIHSSVPQLVAILTYVLTYLNQVLCEILFYATLHPLYFYIGKCDLMWLSSRAKRFQIILRYVSHRCAAVLCNELLMFAYLQSNFPITYWRQIKSESDTKDNSTIPREFRELTLVHIGHRPLEHQRHVYIIGGRRCNETFWFSLFIGNAFICVAY